MSSPRGLPPSVVCLFVASAALPAVQCGPSAPPSSPANEVTRIPAVASGAAAPADDRAESPGRKAPTTLPPVENATNDDKLAFLSTICRVATKRDEGNTHVGCTTCPPFEGPEALPDGGVTEDPDPFYELEVLKFGSFTSAGAEEAAATFAGCEPHAANYGGTLLARRDKGMWKGVRYDSGVHPDQCLTHRQPDGRDILVCSWGDGHQSNWHTQMLTYDFNGPDLETRWQEIITVDDSSAAGCLGWPPGSKVPAGRLVGFGLMPLDDSVAPALVVDFDYAAAEPNAAYQALCKKMFEAIESDSSTGVDPAKALGPMTRHRLVYLPTPSGFVPTPETKKIDLSEPF